MPAHIAAGTWNSMVALDVRAGFAQNDVAGSIGDCTGQNRRKKKISCFCVPALTVGRPFRFTAKMTESTAAGNTTGSIFMGGIWTNPRLNNLYFSLRQHRTVKVVSWRVNFASGADADFAGLLAVNQEKCIR